MQCITKENINNVNGCWNDYVLQKNEYDATKNDEPRLINKLTEQIRTSIGYDRNQFQSQLKKLQEKKSKVKSKHQECVTRNSSMYVTLFQKKQTQNTRGSTGFLSAERFGLGSLFNRGGAHRRRTCRVVGIYNNKKCKKSAKTFTRKVNKNKSRRQPAKK